MSRSIGSTLLAFVTVFYVTTVTHCDLYNSSDPLVLLDNNTFYKTVIGARNAWIIEFYASWCGHCIKFAPKWRELSYEVIDWGHTIKAAVIDCADEENGPVCKDYEVNSYPTVRLFGANMQKGDLGLLLTNKEVDKIQEDMINFLSSQQELNKGDQAWPILSLYEGSLEDIFASAGDKVQKAVVIVEGNGSYVGSKVILDLGMYSLISVKRMEAESTYLSSVTLPSVPAVIVVERNGKYEVLSEPVSTREEITALIIHHLHLRKMMLNPGFKDPNLPSEDNEKPNTTVVKPFESSSDQVYMVDIENALSYAFRHEIPLRNTFSHEELTALKNFTTALLNHLPARPPVVQFFVNLNDLLKKATDLTGEDFERMLLESLAENAQLPEKQSWKGCLGSEPKYRGYPCGLWTLFHALTVNAALQNQYNPTYDPQAILSDIHGFVKYFFGCRECSEHFQEMYAADAETFVHRLNDEVVWLWKSHNKVNERLKGQLSEDPQHLKQLFPLQQRCPECWNTDQSFNVESVIDYLKDIYGPASISLEGAKNFSTSGASKAALGLNHFGIVGFLLSFSMALSL